MENFSNKVLAITSINSGVCVNDSFISLVNNLASSMGRSVDYFSFNKVPNFPEVTDLCDKDILDRLCTSIGNYEFVVVDKRLDLPTLNVVIGFILSEGKQVGSFYIDDPEVQDFIESELLLRKDLHKESKTVLVVSSDGSGEGNPVDVHDALNYLIKDDYNQVVFLEGNYDMSFLYRVLAYCYDTGVIVVDSKLPDGVYIRIIESKW